MPERSRMYFFIFDTTMSTSDSADAKVGALAGAGAGAGVAAITRRGAAACCGESLAAVSAAHSAAVGDILSMAHDSR